MIRYADGCIRYLTVFEAKRIQTFPGDFIIKGAWGEAMRQIGNAVPVLLAEILGATLATTLNDKKDMPRRFVKYDSVLGMYHEQLAQGAVALIDAA